MVGFVGPGPWSEPGGVWQGKAGTVSGEGMTRWEQRLATALRPHGRRGLSFLGRPVVAAIDEGTEVPRILAMSGAGVSVPPDDIEAFVGALRELIGDSSRRELLGRNAREWVVSHVSPDAVADAYLSLVGSGR